MSELIAPERPATKESNQNDIIDWSVLTEVSEDVIDANEHKEAFARTNDDTTETPILGPILDVDEPPSEIPPTVKINDSDMISYLQAKIGDELEYTDPEDISTKNDLSATIDVLEDLRGKLNQPDNKLSAVSALNELVSTYENNLKDHSDHGNQTLANKAGLKYVAAAQLATTFENLKTQHEMAITPKGYTGKPITVDEENRLTGDVIS